MQPISLASRSEPCTRCRRHLDATIDHASSGTFLVYSGFGGDTGTYLVIADIDSLLRRQLEHYPPPTTRDSAIQRANALITDVAHLIRDFETRERYMGIGLGIAVAQLLPAHVVVSNIGACRVYLHHDTPRVVSTDHTWVAEQTAAGLLSPNDEETYRLRHVTTRAVSAKYPVWGPADHAFLTVTPGDRLFLSSPTLWEFLTDGDLARLLSFEPMDVIFEEVFRTTHARLQQANPYGVQMAGLLVSLGTA